MRPTNYVRISTAARPTERNKSSTVLKGHDKQTVVCFSSLIENEIEIAAELDKRQDAVGCIDPQQLPVTDDIVYVFKTTMIRKTAGGMRAT